MPGKVGRQPHEIASEVEDAFVTKTQFKQQTCTIQCICLHPERGMASTVCCHRCATWQHTSCYTACFGRTVSPHTCIHCEAPALAISRGLVKMRYLHVYTIKCICGPDDDISTARCGVCNTWHHLACYNFGSEYRCLDCFRRPFDYTRARTRWKSFSKSSYIWPIRQTWPRI